jgi:hypothetical protein
MRASTTGIRQPSDLARAIEEKLEAEQRAERRLRAQR